jgi:hypothetical protein
VKKKRAHMPRITVDNTDTDAAAAATSAVQISTSSAAGLAFKSGYEMHSAYPVQLQSMDFTDAAGVPRKRVWMRSAVKKSAKDSDALFQNADAYSQ